MGNSADSEERFAESVSLERSKPFGDALRQDIQALTRGIEKLACWIQNLSSVVTETNLPAAPGGLRKVGNLQLDPTGHQVLISGHRIDLSAGEFRLLQRLVAEYPEVVGFHELHLAYQGETANSDRNLRVYVRRLRVKLNSGTEKWNGRIANIRSIGYRIIGP